MDADKHRHKYQQQRPVHTEHYTTRQQPADNHQSLQPCFNPAPPERRYTAPDEPTLAAVYSGVCTGIAAFQETPPQQAAEASIIEAS